MVTRIVTGTLVKADGSPWVDAAVKFTLARSTYTASETHPISSAQATTDQDGVFSVILSAGLSTRYRVSLPDGEVWSFYVPIGDPTTLEALLIANATPPNPPDLQDLIDAISDATQGVLSAIALATDGKAIIAPNGDLAAVDGTFTGDLAVAGSVTLPAGALTSTAISNFIEAAQDAAGVTFADSSTIDATYDDDGNQVTLAVIPGGISHEDIADIGSNTHPQIDDHIASTSNPHGVTKAQVGLGSVDNTADSAKPVSTAQQTALNLKANLASPTFTGTVGGITKVMVGLANVDNTSDANKPVSTAQAAANTTDRARANHTGSQAASSISDFATAADARISAAAGVSLATLVAGKVPTAQLPGLALTGVQTAANQAAQLALTTQEGDVVVRTDESKTYMRNGGTSGTMADYTLLSTPSDAVSSVNGQTGVVVLGKGDVGLGNVDNTSDANKPVSTAQASADATKQGLNGNLTALSGLTGAADRLAYFTGAAAMALATLTSYGRSLMASADAAAAKTLLALVKADVGLGNVDNTADTAKPVSAAQQAALDLKANLASPTFTGTVSGITKAMVGLGNVDNTADADKPVSTTQQTALNAKQPLNADLTTIAGLSPADDDVLQRKAGGWVSRTMAQLKTDLALAFADIVAALGYTPVNRDGDTISGNLVLERSVADVLLEMKGYSGNTGFVGYRANGTLAVPSATTANQLLFTLGGKGHTGSAFTTLAKALISLITTEDWSGTAQGTAITFATTRPGTTTRSEAFRVAGTEVVHNETGIDLDFRAEGDTDVNLVFVDASTDRVGIGTSTPATKLDVQGVPTFRDPTSPTKAMTLALSGITAGQTRTYTAPNADGTLQLQAQQQTATITSGSVALTGTWISILVVDTEASAATDDLDTITGGTTGQVLFVQQSNSSRDITFTHLGGGGGSSSFLLAGAANFTPGTSNSVLMLIFNGSRWQEVSRSISS